jgi:ATP-dependent Lhr-like helicase
MTSPHSSSDRGHALRSSAFELLHEEVQRWIWIKKWAELRDLQEAAVAPILAGTTDVILSAATASGKTEAAFLPICSRIAEEPGGGVNALYVSPLKALINDQLRRLDDLCERLKIPVHRWHGDVSSDKKQRFLRDPAGILLITPESLEALFVNHGPHIGRLFLPLSYVVVDELHVFIGSERGKQLQSLLHRVEIALGRSVSRVALSATLGDMGIAADFLRPGRAGEVRQIASTSDGSTLKLIVRGYLTKPFDPSAIKNEEVDTEDAHLIAEHLFTTLRGSDNLIFANSRRDVELYTDMLARRSEQEKVPNEFFAHHGSLSKELREDVEARLRKESPGPVNVVCTSTLELGIDIGSVRSVAQIGAPVSVASIRQRLGRSGRRDGEAAVLRVYVREREVTAQTAPEDSLRVELVQTVAILSLLLQRWCEPPTDGALHLSTLIQQILSTIAQHGGVKALDVYRALCETGPFVSVPKPMFVSLLRRLGEKDLIMQSSDGALLLGVVGERIVNHFSFYTAFATPEEYRLVTGGKLLGTLPVQGALTERMYLLFAGRRWRIVAIDEERKVIDLVPAGGGRAPRFLGQAGTVHDVVRKEMYSIYTSFEVPSFLDARASELLLEARMNFDRLLLRERSLIPWGDGALFFPWAGDRVMNTIAVQMAERDVEVAKSGVALRFEGVPIERAARELQSLAERAAADPATLAASVRNKLKEKYDGLLSEELLSATYASSMLDTAGAARLVGAAIRRDAQT